ncbi:MAG TPA: hypothetical protein VLM75_15075 [Spirochaetota bacterium]|nr:hypothetical protein [Spirochaetota bacterium]
MIYRNTIIIALLAATVLFPLLSCQTGPLMPDDGRFKQPDTYNFKFIGYDTNITNPENDRRSYYRIYINKIEIGRTTIGLESQDKSFESRIQPNRHLLVVEKWALDEKSEKYVKLNNIHQPRPNFVYFGLPEKRIVVITLKNDILRNRTSFEIDYEHE